MSAIPSDCTRAARGVPPRVRASGRIAPVLMCALATGCAAPHASFTIRRPAYWTISPAEQTVEVVVDGAIDGIGAAQLHDGVTWVIALGANPSLHVGPHPTIRLRVHVIQDEYHAFIDHRTIGSGRLARAWEVPEARASCTIEFKLESFDGRTILDTVLDAHADEDDPVGRSLLSNLRSELVRSFARYIEPWNDHLSIHFSDCMRDSRCRNGIQATERARDDDAERSFTAVIEEFQSTAQGFWNRRRVAGAYMDRAIVRARAGRFDGARDDVTRAESLRPHDPDVERARHDVLEMRDAAEHLAAQQVLPPTTRE